MKSVFRRSTPTERLRSDRSAGDRARHRQKVRDAIRKNISDVVADESIIGRSGEKTVKVPIRGVKEYRFVHGDNSPGVASGDGETEPGQVVGRADQGQGQGAGPAGDAPGEDVYETEITLEELVEIMFEDLELPRMERKRLREVLSEAPTKRRGYRRAGVRAHLDRRKTARERVRRSVATRGGTGADGGERFPFHQDDLRYRRMRPEPKPHSNAVVVCLMDTSASMDTTKKYLARSFFFLLYQFVRTRYAHVELVFIAHDTEAREVTEDEFFHKGESGGTRISSGYEKAIEVIENRYHPSLWNAYAFHCSDGDNWPDDHEATLKAARGLADLCNFFGYGEIKPQGLGYYGGSMIERFGQIEADNFQPLLITGKEDIWPAFKKLLGRERAA